MPIMDASQYLRDGSTALTATGNGSGVLIGEAPFTGLGVVFYLPSAPTTVTIKLEESDNNSDWSDVPGMSYTWTAAGTWVKPLHHTMRYLRWNCTAITGSCGNVVIAVCPVSLEET